MHFDKKSVAEATEDALRAADHLSEKHAGAVAALRALALRIDTQDLYFEALSEQASERGSRPPSVDNVSLPTYLKFCDALGLTAPAASTSKPASGSAPAPAEPTPATGLAKFRRPTAVPDAV